MRYGYFDNEHREYVITRPDAPASWTNYLGVKDLCTVLSQNAGGYSFYQSAEHHRITRFRSNGVPLDRPGHYVYLRDDQTREYWSVSWHIPADWSEFEVVRQWRGATFRIAVANPDGVEKGVKSISMDGNPVEGPIPPQKEGTEHDIRVTMG